MNKYAHLNVQYRRYLVNLRSRTFSSTRSTDGTYYDSQSARWITPHDPTYFRLTVDANNNPALKSIQLQNDVHGQIDFLSKRYSQFLLPIASDVFDEKKNNNPRILNQNKNLDSAVNDSMAILSTSDLKNPIKIPSYTMMNVNVKTNDSSTIDETKKIVEENFEIGNRIRCTMTKFDSMAPWEVGRIAAEMCDVGCEEIFLDNVSQDDFGMDIDELIQVMEEICYIDAPGGPMLGRLGLNFVPEDEFMEEAVLNMGVSKLLVKEEHLSSCLEFIRWRNYNHDVKLVL